VSVRLAEIRFRNGNPFTVHLTVEAPSGTTVLGPVAVTPMSSATLLTNVDDCSIVRLTAADPALGERHQVFAAASPLEGQPAYIERIEITYAAGVFEGRFCGRTSGFG
jgi:hypothetical protein